MQIMERSEAKTLGLTTYYTGKLCANGHKSYRYVQSGSCSECINGDRAVGTFGHKERRIANLRNEAESLMFRAAQLNSLADEIGLQISKDQAAYEENSKVRRAILEEKRKQVIENLQVKQSQTEKNRLAREAARAEKLRLREIKKERDETLKDFVKFNEPILPNYINHAKSLLHAYAIMRSPHISVDDLWLKVSPVHSVLYVMKAHPDDIPAIREQLKQWYSAESNINEIRDNIIKNKILNLT